MWKAAQLKKEEKKEKKQGKENESEKKHLTQ